MLGMFGVITPSSPLVRPLIGGWRQNYNFPITTTEIMHFKYDFWYQANTFDLIYTNLHLTQFIFFKPFFALDANGNVYVNGGGGGGKKKIT